MYEIVSGAVSPYLMYKMGWADNFSSIVQYFSDWADYSFRWADNLSRFL